MRKGGKLEGWKVEKLGDVVDFQRGLTYSKKDEVDYSSNIVLRATNVDVNTNTLDFSELKYINEKIVVSKERKVRKGSLIICTASGSKSHLGKVALIDDDYDYAFGGFMGQITPRQILDSKFLFYSLTSEAYKKYIDELSDGVNINNLRFDDLANFEIPIPSLPEQQRIVSMLDEAFASIAQAKSNAERNLVNARELFEAVLQSLVSNDEWEKKTLKEISITFGRGKSKNRPRGDPKLYGGKYPFIQTGDISNSNHWITTYSQTYNELGLAQSKLWTKGTICIAIVGANVGETAILDFGACFPDSVIGIVVNDKTTSNEYVEYLLQTFKTAFKVMGKGTARDNINMGMFENRKFPFPPLAEQRAIVGRLEALSAETGRLEEIYQSKVDGLEELKKSVLQKAFEGEL